MLVKEELYGWKEQQVIAKELAQELGRININDEPQKKESMLFDEVKEDCLLPIWNTADNFLQLRRKGQRLTFEEKAYIFPFDTKKNDD